jgi:hypothetical protein
MFKGKLTVLFHNVVHMSDSESNWTLTKLYASAINTLTGLPYLVQLVAVARVRGQVMWDLWWTKWHWNRFSPSTLISPSNHSTDCSTLIIIIIIIWGWYSRPNSGWCQVDSVSPHPEEHITCLHDVYFSVSDHNADKSLLPNSDLADIVKCYSTPKL